MMKSITYLARINGPFNVAYLTRHVSFPCAGVACPGRNPVLSVCERRSRVRRKHVPHVLTRAVSGIILKPSRRTGRKTATTTNRKIFILTLSTDMTQLSIG